MFISIRGTNGAGKTTLVRKLQQAATKIKIGMVTGRKRPAWEVYQLPSGKVFATLGHYDSECGGCDTINKVDDAYGYAQRIFDRGGVDAVISEGMIISKDVKRIVNAKNPYIVYINIPIEDCYEGVKQRRLKKGEIEKAEIPPKSLADNLKGIDSAVRRLKGKVNVIEVNRDEAFTKILNLIENN